METSTRLSTLALLFAAMTLSANVFAAALPEGTLNVTVVDENGAVVQDAPVYIYGEHKTHFIGGKNIPGTVTIAMVAGDYKISSAIIKKNGDYLDRYASHEAHVTVVEGDNASVILTLKSINDPTATITTAEMRKVGVTTRDF